MSEEYNFVKTERKKELTIIDYKNIENEVYYDLEIESKYKGFNIINDRYGKTIFQNLWWNTRSYGGFVNDYFNEYIKILPNGERFGEISKQVLENSLEYFEEEAKELMTTYLKSYFNGYIGFGDFMFDALDDINKYKDIIKKIKEWIETIDFEKEILFYYIV
jgi:hypothetical protein